MGWDKSELKDDRDIRDHRDERDFRYDRALGLRGELRRNPTGRIKEGVFKTLGG